MEKKKIRICMVGFGNAGRAFCRMLLYKSEELESTYGYEPVVTAICTKTKGILLNTGGLNLQQAIEEAEQRGGFLPDNTGLYQGTVLEAIERSCADVLLELSTLSIFDGQPAITHIEKALDLGMHVVTANKGPIAWAYSRLKEKADSRNRMFLFEATVMDGTPVYNLVKETLPGCRVIAFKGILNSTTNFILEEMEKGASYEASLKEAQMRGFAEADPSMDIDGWDAAAKTAALINVLLKGEVTPIEIRRTGISAITLDEINRARSEGKKIKLLCEGRRTTDGITGIVHPVKLDEKDFFSLIDATSSILSITTDLMGEICIVEKDPEIQQTAYGIFSDFLTILKNISGIRRDYAKQ